MLTDEQKAVRRTGITATDMSAILGLNPNKTPLQVALDKQGRLPDVEENEDMQRGNFLEPALIGWYSKRLGVEVSPGRTVVNESNPLIIATPDGFTPFGVLEVKSPGDFSAKEWGLEGTDIVPHHYLVQCHWQMAATNSDRCDLAALLRGRLLVYILHRSKSFEEELVGYAERFFSDYIATGKLPEAKGADLDALRRVFPRHGKTYEEADAKVIQEYKAARESRLAAAKREASAKARLQVIIGDAEGLRGDWGRVQWASGSPRTITNWESTTRELARKLERSGSAEARKWLIELNAVAAKHTKDIPGARRFCAYFNDDNEFGVG